jgi:hypothetical protein
MAAAAILEVVGHFRFYIFDFDRMTRTYLSNFIRMRRKLTELLQFFFFKLAAAAILDLMIGDINLCTKFHQNRVVIAHFIASP